MAKTKQTPRKHQGSRYFMQWPPSSSFMAPEGANARCDVCARRHVPSAGETCNECPRRYCSKACEIVDAPYHVCNVTDRKNDIVIRNSPGKGLGIFAKGEWDSGDVVIIESANLLASELEDGAPIPHSIMRECKLLHKGGHPDTLFRFNGFRIKCRDSGQEDAAIFLTASRFNHSCTANCIYTFPAHDAIEIRSLTGVPEGEEMTIAYTDPLKLHEERRRQLVKDFGFECQCPACADVETREEVRPPPLP